MLKKSVAALALFSGLITSTHAFAAAPDLVIDAAQLRSNMTVEVVVRNRGTAPATACVAEVRYYATDALGMLGDPTIENSTLPSRWVDKFTAGLRTLAAGEQVSLVIDLSKSLLRQSKGQILYFKAFADCDWKISEKVEVAGVEISGAGENNNTLDFSWLR